MLKCPQVHRYQMLTRTCQTACLIIVALVIVISDFSYEYSRVMDCIRN